MQDTTKSLIATSLAHFVNDGSGYVFITLYPKLLPLPSDLFLIGILAGLQNSLSVVMSPIVGRTADAKKNYGVLLSIGLFLLGVGIIGYAISVFITSGFLLFVFLIPFTIIAGVGSSFYHPLGASVLNEKWKSHSLGRALGLNGSLGSTGRAIYPLIVVALVVYLTIPSVTLLAVVAFVSVAIVLRMINSISFGNKDFKPKDRADSQVSDNVTRKKSISIGSILPGILPLTIISFFKGLFMLGIVNFVPVYLRHVSGLQYGLELGAVFTLILGLPILGQPVLGYAADRWGRRLALGISIGGSALAILFLLHTTNIFFQVAALGAYCFFGFTGFPLLLPLATAAVPEEAATFSNSIVWGVGNVGGGAVGPILVGFLAGPALLGSLNSAFFVVAIVSLGSLALLPFVPKPRGRS